MKLGIHNKFLKIYFLLLSKKFQFYNYLFGFENATKILYTLDKRAVIQILTKNGAKIGTNCDIETPIIFHHCKNFKNLTIGNNCHIGKNSFIDLSEHIEIGNNVTISMKSSLITHLDVGFSSLQSKYPKRREKIHIESDVYIGINCTILMGVRIESNSLIAAGSIVTSNILPYTLAGGIPAKSLKRLI